MSDLWEESQVKDLKCGDVFRRSAFPVYHTVKAIGPGPNGSKIVSVDDGDRELYTDFWDPERRIFRRAKLNRHRAIATVAKMLVDDKTIPDGERLAGALMQMLGAGGAKPYEVEE